MLMPATQEDAFVKPCWYAYQGKISKKILLNRKRAYICNPKR